MTKSCKSWHFLNGVKEIEYVVRQLGTCLGSGLSDWVPNWDRSQTQTQQIYAILTMPNLEFESKWQFVVTQLLVEYLFDADKERNV